MTLFSSLSAAQAGDITNLSGKDQVVEVGVGQNLHPITIANGSTYHDAGETQVRYKGASEITVHYNEEYAIWPGDEFGPQELINRGFGNNSR